MNEIFNPLGTIYISHRAIASIASQSALESYGVIDLAPRNLLEGIEKIFLKDPLRGVDVFFDGSSITVDLFLVIEYGTRITMVASSVAESVKYHIEKALSLTVAKVNIHVRGLRISNLD